MTNKRKWAAIGTASVIGIGLAAGGAIATATAMDLQNVSSVKTGNGIQAPAQNTQFQTANSPAAPDVRADSTSIPSSPAAPAPAPVNSVHTPSPVEPAPPAPAPVVSAQSVASAPSAASVASAPSAASAGSAGSAD